MKRANNDDRTTTNRIGLILIYITGLTVVLLQLRSLLG